MSKASLRNPGTSSGISPCPFCGGTGYLEFELIRGSLFVSIGCLTPECREFIHAQPIARPDSDLLKLVDQWNRRPETPQATKCGRTGKPIDECNCQPDDFCNDYRG